ncbi:MAG: hypothetical protein ACJAUL_000188 [Paraglaciecola sp.]|jgi:hypothetical protein
MAINVLLIGSGKRIRNNFIPALMCLNDTHKISGLYSPTKTHREEVCDKWNILPISSLTDYSFDTIDVIVVSVTTTATPEVLNLIISKCKNKILVIDTPIFSSLKDFRFAIKLNTFKKVLVTEDYIGFPQFKIMRDYATKGKFGKIKNVELFQTGFQYHGLALIRSFVNLRKVKGIKRIKNSAREFFFTFNFSDETKGYLSHPYKRLKGWAYLAGNTGSMIYDPDDLFDYSKDPKVMKLSYQKNLDNHVTFLVDNVAVATQLQAYCFQKIMELDLEDNSDFNTFKTCGLLDIMRATGGGAIPNNYSLSEALYDSAIAKLFWRRQIPPQWRVNFLLMALKVGIWIITKHR